MRKGPTCSKPRRPVLEAPASPVLPPRLITVDKVLSPQTSDCAATDSTKCSGDDAATAAADIGVADLQRGVLWQCCPGGFSGARLAFLREAAAGLSASAAAFAADAALAPDPKRLSPVPSGAQINDGLLECAAEGSGFFKLTMDETQLEDGITSVILDGQRDVIQVFVPEAMAELGFCCWDGDGHYDMSLYPGDHPPTLGQVIAFLLMLDATVEQSHLALIITSERRRAAGAVLAGAVLVLSLGFSAEAAWEKLLEACPEPSKKATEAWDRFPPPFSVEPYTGPSSVSVLDCLEGLEFARDRGWIGGDYRKFDVANWRLLRQQLDASWLIPGEVLAMGNPTGTAQNPCFPNLLLPSSLPQALSDSALQKKRGMAALSIDTGTPKGERTLGQRSVSAPNFLELGIEREPASAVSTASLSMDDALSAAFAAEESVTQDEKAEETETGERRNTGRRKVSKVYEEAEAAKIVELANSLDDQESQLARAISPRWADKFTLTDEDGFVSYMLRSDVKIVVRLNRDAECPAQSIHEALFRHSGVEVMHLTFDDCTIPPRELVVEWLKLCRKTLHKGSAIGTQQCIAVHCMGGLGRTGVMVGVWAVSRHRMKGTAFHGWSRMCRPGTVQTVGQETFLRSLKPKSESLRDHDSPTKGPSGVLASMRSFAIDISERYSRMYV
eukprot:TRINITY_DN39220_c0_g1_i1.p1 TRINITY_DN39220_c0_g1~~TRINITY_DN39220_c0_g1_i1.p1  ORF type:complete len:682 (-),score=124.11 TRINITY_DN39220_c0_g1_i1:73-2088(-)